jgi:hypothetical protein
MKYKELWDRLNSKEREPWGFIWGENDMSHIKKACATVMMESFVESWLDTPSPAFKQSPRKAIEDGKCEEVYLAVYTLGTGEFS